jgi:hypothetical protein
LNRSEHDYWICQLAGWGTLTVFAVLSSSFGDWRAALRFAVAKSAVSLTGLLLSHLWRGHLRRKAWIDRASGLPLGQIAIGLLGLAIVQTGCLLLADLIFRHGAFFEGGADDPLLFNIGLLVFLWFLVFAFWTLCYAVALSRRRAARFELEKLRMEVNVKEAELRALQSQVNPHFFFNSLSSIRALVYEDAGAAALAINRLAGMMRHSLKSDRQATVPLSEELAAVEAYLEMEKLRFEDRLQPQLDIAPGLESVALPPMLLQTLVENAVRHGVERATGPCRIMITAGRAEGGVSIQVANQGRLAVDSASTRLGLANASRRLALQFGDRATCSIAESEGWVTATLSLPREAAA